MWQDFIKGAAPLVLVMLLSSCSGLQQVSSEPQVAAEGVQISAAAERAYQEILVELAAEDDSGAVKKLEKFIVRYPDFPGAYTNLAIIYDRQDRSTEALEALAIALSIDSNFAPAHNQVGVIKRRSGEFSAAEQAWKAAIAADPDYSYAWHNLGVLYELYLADLPNALEHYRRYQLLANNNNVPDQQVDRWVADLQRRVGEPARTAKVLGEPQ